DRLLGPPAIDDAPFLAHDRHELAVDDTGLSPTRRLHERGPRGVQASRDTSDGAHRTSRGTTNARVSGIRDHGAKSVGEPMVPPRSPLLLRRDSETRTWPPGRQSRPPAAHRNANATRSYIPRHHQRARLRDSRPRRHLDNGADRPSTRARTHLAQAFP